MESIIESHSRESLDSNLYNSLKIQNISIVNRFDSLGKKTLELVREERKKKLLEIILRKKIKKIMFQSFVRWNVRTDPNLIKTAIHSMFYNAPTSKVSVFYRLFHDRKRIIQNKDRTFFSLVNQNGERSKEVVQNVGGYLNRRRKSALVEMAKLHDSLSLLDKKKQRQIIDSIAFKISQAQFSAKHHSLKNCFQNINNAVKKQFKFFKDVRINKLLYSILTNKRKQYFKIWFVKTNEVLLPSNISSIQSNSENQAPSVFWTSLLHKPSPQISFLAEQSRMKENTNFSKLKSGTVNQNQSTTPRKMFIDEQPKRNLAGLMIANSFSYLSEKKSQISVKKKDHKVQFKHLHYILSSIIKMRLCNGFSSIKHANLQTSLSSKQSIQQFEQMNKIATKLLFNIIQKQIVQIQREVFEILIVVNQ